MLNLHFCMVVGTLECTSVPAMLVEQIPIILRFPVRSQFLRFILMEITW